MRRSSTHRRANDESRRRSVDVPPNSAGVVENKAAPCNQHGRIERTDSEEPLLLADREKKLDARVRDVLDNQRSNCIEHDRDRSLVIGADDRGRRVSNESVDHDRAQRLRRRNGVEMSAKKERLSRGRGRDVAVEVVAITPECGARPIPLHVEPQLGELGDDRLRTGASLPVGLGIEASAQKRLTRREDSGELVGSTSLKCIVGPLPVRNVVCVLRRSRSPAQLGHEGRVLAPRMLRPIFRRDRPAGRSPREAATDRQACAAVASRSGRPG